jgi:hypothetical protein
MERAHGPRLVDQELDAMAVEDGAPSAPARRRPSAPSSHARETIPRRASRSAPRKRSTAAFRPAAGHDVAREHDRSASILATSRTSCSSHSPRRARARRRDEASAPARRAREGGSDAWSRETTRPRAASDRADHRETRARPCRRVRRTGRRARPEGRTRSSRCGGASGASASQERTPTGPLLRPGRACRGTP